MGMLLQAQESPCDRVHPPPPLKPARAPPRSAPTAAIGSSSSRRLSCSTLCRSWRAAALLFVVMASEHGIVSAPVFAASIEAKRSRAEDSGEVGVLKVARLKELRSRLSPVSVSSSLPSSPVVDPLSGAHVAGSSPSLPALASHAIDLISSQFLPAGSESANPFEAALEPRGQFAPSPHQASSAFPSLPLPPSFPEHMVDEKSQIVIGVRRDDGRDAGDVVESRVVGQDHCMTADRVIVVDNSGSKSLQGGVSSSGQDGFVSERRVVEKKKCLCLRSKIILSMRALILTLRLVSHLVHLMFRQCLMVN